MPFLQNWYSLLGALAKEQKVDGYTFKFEVLWIHLGHEDACNEEGGMPTALIASAPASAVVEPGKVSYYAEFLFDRDVSFNSIVMAAKSQEGAWVPVAKACRQFSLRAGDGFRAEFAVMQA